MKIVNNQKPSRNLEQALANLEVFSAQVEKELVPNLAHLEVKEGKLVVTAHPSLKKTISLAYSNILSPKLDSQSEVLNEILHSSDVIKSYLPLLQVMEEGNAEQKKFAAYAKEAIERFNRILKQASEKTYSWQKRFVCFLYQKSGLHIGDRLVRIDFPQKAFVAIDFLTHNSTQQSAQLKINHIHKPTPGLAEQRISNLRDTTFPAYQIQKQTLELYHMKVIALLERHHLLPPQEARHLVLNGPIKFELDKSIQQLTISQDLRPLPGQHIFVSATFKMDQRTLIYSIFDSDHLSLESTQTGFPHPLQHHGGLPLSEKLIPQCLHRPNRLHFFPEIREKQLNAALGLLPNGPLIEKARHFLRLKRKVFEAHKEVFIEMHKSLALAILSASNVAVTKEKKEIMIFFFNSLADQLMPYDFLAETHEYVGECIQSLQGRLERSWLEGKLVQERDVENLIDEYYSTISIDKQLNEGDAIKAAYQNLLLEVLREPVEQIFLQYYSEILAFSPSPLTDFSKKIQIALYGQLWEFTHELSLNPLEVDIFERLNHLLKADISLFQAPNISIASKAAAITQELEEYYKARYSDHSLD